MSFGLTLSNTPLAGFKDPTLNVHAYPVYIVMSAFAALISTLLAATVTLFPTPNSWFWKSETNILKLSPLFTTKLTESSLPFTNAVSSPAAAPNVQNPVDPTVSHTPPTLLVNLSCVSVRVPPLYVTVNAPSN